MIESEERMIRFRGCTVPLTVIRNNGACWGRIRVQDDEQFDVITRKDWYDYADDDALDAFERASRNPKCVEPAVG